MLVERFENNDFNYFYHRSLYEIFDVLPPMFRHENMSFINIKHFNTV